MQRRIIMEVFTLIARKKNVALVFVSYLLVALAAISYVQENFISRIMIKMNNYLI